ncbi:unnamed protein product [Protopolystoma xenopodis]|uniref:Uncharacterized protein n=1 Tax=Protopolystoma xenopodis TaxID=117903 RepID=A0A448XA83_9PLAT|nr:unnamed protein product [Protopolystoma xenopodis]
MISTLEESDNETKEDLHDSLQDVGFSGNFSSQDVGLLFDDLSTLFNCLQIAYDGELTSPKWNQFKGVKPL